MTPTMPLSVLRRITTPTTSVLVPELCYRGVPEGETLEGFRTSHVATLGVNVPYWAVAWPGGQALARYLLDRPKTVAGRPVVDLGCGNGLVAAAAMMAGAASALAIDLDAQALTAAAETARLNDVAVDTLCADLAGIHPQPDAVICAADLWYEPVLGRHATAALSRLAQTASLVLIADPGRPGRPRRGISELARYPVPVSQEFERAAVIETRVFKFANRDILARHPPHAPNGRGIREAIGVKLNATPPGPISGRK